MSALLDLDDVVAGNPAAQRELAALRDQVAALTAGRDGAVYVSQKMLEQNTYLVEQSNAPVPAQPAAAKGSTHCDECGCDWLDNGLNPVGCPYCKRNDDKFNPCLNDLVRQVALMMDDCEEHADGSISIDCDISQGFLRRIYDLLNALEDCGYDAIEPKPAAVPEAVAKASKLLRAHNEWRRGADNTDAYTATGLGNAIDTVCDHIEEVLGMVSTQIIPADVMNDAARYQWLKQRSPFGNRAPHIEQYPFQSGFDKVKLPHFTVVGLDDAIDAAIDAAILSAADTEVKK